MESDPESQSSSSSEVSDSSQTLAKWQVEEISVIVEAIENEIRNKGQVASSTMQKYVNMQKRVIAATTILPPIIPKDHVEIVAPTHPCHDLMMEEINAQRQLIVGFPGEKYKCWGHWGEQVNPCSGINFAKPGLLGLHYRHVITRFL